MNTCQKNYVNMKEVCEIAETREQRIAKYRAIVEADPSNDSARGLLRDNLNSWYEHDVLVEVQVANNEQLPWTEFDIGLRTVKMLTKQSTQYDQVGDYIFTVKYKDRGTTGSLVAERKSFVDLLGTLKDKEHYKKLIKEVDRFLADDRFDQFFIFAECTKEEFLSWKPSRVMHNTKRKQNPNYKPLSAEQQAYNHRAVMEGKIWKLGVRGAPILWEGSRQQAALSYSTAVRHWCLKNYDKITGVSEE